MQNAMSHPVHTTIASDGTIFILEAVRAELGLHEGSRLIVRVEESAIVLEPVEAAIGRAQALIRRYIPEGTDLVGELISERRADSERA